MNVMSDKILTNQLATQTTDTPEDSSTVDISETSSKRNFLHEDWVVVVVGFLIIGITLFGFVLPVPSFGWKSSAELFSKVLSKGNLGIIGLQFLYVFGAAIIGALLTGKPLKSFITVFPVIYLL